MKAKRFLKKALTIVMCAVLFGDTAVMLPAVSSEVSVSADAAEVYGDFMYEIYGDEVTITSYTGNGGDVTIPDKIDEKPVTRIRKYAFSYCNWPISVTIPDSVTSIDYCAFYKCIALKSVTISDSVTSIGTDAFEKCMNLTSVTIGKSVTSIGNSAFAYCSSLKSIIIPDSVTSIEGGTFFLAVQA